MRCFRCGKENQDPLPVARISEDLRAMMQSLNAIWNLPFKANEKLILHYIASQLDFRTDFLDWRQISRSQIEQKTGLKRTACRDTIRKLEIKGYIVAHGDNKSANYYRITEKLFIRYEAWLNGVSARKDAKLARSQRYMWKCGGCDQRFLRLKRYEVF